MTNLAVYGSYADVGGSALMFRNKVINGNFDIWQRGTTVSSTTNGIFSADRFYTTVTGTGISFTYSQSTDVPSLFAPYSAKLTQSSGNATGVTEYALRHTIEMQNVLPLIGKPVTVSFWYKSSIAGTHGVRLISANITGGTDVTLPFTVNNANTWEYKTLTFSSLQAGTAVTGALNGTGLYLDIGFRVAGTGAGQTSVALNAFFNLSQVQVESGTVATPFEQRPVGLELMLCQRYYSVMQGSSQNPCATGFAVNAVSLATNLKFPTTMRSQPTITIYSYANTAAKVAAFGSATDVGTSVTAKIEQIGTNGLILLNDSGSGFTAGATYWFWYTAVAELY